MKKLLFLLIILVFLTSCSYIDQMKRDITGGAIINEGLNEQGIRLDSGKIDVYFCPRDNCEEKLINIIKESQKVNCAFYELNLNNLAGFLIEKNASVVVDNDNYDKSRKLISSIKKDNRTALMHDKFCIFDGKIIS